VETNLLLILLLDDNLGHTCQSDKPSIRDKVQRGIRDERATKCEEQHAQNYINYEEKLLADKVDKTKTSGKKDDENQDEKKKGPKGTYSKYIPLNTSREKNPTRVY
jgi:hypothetical protein